MLLSNPDVYTDQEQALSFRQAAWQAISVSGSDMSGGAGLYEVLCDFECMSVQRLVEQHGATSNTVKNAADVAHAVWEKRASAALPGGEEVLQAYKDWNDALPDAGLRKPITDKLRKARFLAHSVLSEIHSGCLLLHVTLATHNPYTWSVHTYERSFPTVP